MFAISQNSIAIKLFLLVKIYLTNLLSEILWCYVDFCNQKSDLLSF